jgi:multiple sugar transport system ATP-binding protein
VAALQLLNLKKSYNGAACVVHGINLDIKDGEFVVFVGPSGCGKSTTLRMIAGLEEISGGELRSGDRVVHDIPPAKRGVAMVFQSYALYPHMTVADNMGFALKLAGKSRAEVSAAVNKAAHTLQIESLLDRKPKALSGGQRQRVAIGRCIVRQPDVFLFDEPLSNLDASLRVQMRVELAQLHRELGVTMVYVTHDQVEAMTLGNRIAVFNAGLIEQCGTPRELYERPSNLFVAGFIGSPSMNLIPVNVRTDETGLPVAMLPGGETWSIPQSRLPSGFAGETLTLGLRPEHLNLTLATHGVPGYIDLVEYLGGEQIAHVRLKGSDSRLVVKLTSSAPAAQAGAIVGVNINPDNFHLFGADGRAINL